MKIFPKLLFILIILFQFSCKSNDSKKIIKYSVKKEDVSFNDSLYVLDSSYEIGDARRYGVTAELAGTNHPNTGKNRMTSVLDLAEASGIEISFPSGYYGMDLTLDSRKNMKLSFNKSEFSLIHITRLKKEDPVPENIEIKGTIIAYARLGLTEAKNIKIDSVLLKSDVTKSLYKMRNTGCHIYYGCKGITINYIEIDDLGSGSDDYKYTHASIAMDGWNNNPSEVTINKAIIKSTDRHGVYMTGQDNTIKNLEIRKFGIGSSLGMDGMQDAVRGEEKEFTALWMNKCDYCYVDKVTINEKGSKGVNTVFLDSGDPVKTSEIGELIILNDNPNINIKKDPNTNVDIVETKFK